MSSIRFVTSSDEHLSDQNPGSRKDDYRSAILKKLEWQGGLARSIKAAALLRGGDLWHSKHAGHNTHRSVATVSEIHRNYSCPTYAIPGNHDMSYNDPDTIPGQPLGVLYKSGVFNQLNDEIFIDGSMSVRVVGVPYTTDLAIGSLHDMVRKKDSHTYTIAFVHALAAMAPEEKIQSFFNETVFDYRDLVFEGCPDVYIFGHYHKDQGIQEHLGVKFVNLGAVSRGALTFENLDRQPKVSSIICNSQGISIESHIIPHEDASVVFDLQKKKENDRVIRSFSDFIKELNRNRQLANNSVEDRLKELELFPKDLQSLIRDYLQAASDGVAIES